MNEDQWRWSKTTQHILTENPLKNLLAVIPADTATAQIVPSISA